MSSFMATRRCSGWQRCRNGEISVTRFYQPPLDGKHDDVDESDFYMKGNISTIKS